MSQNKTYKDKYGTKEFIPTSHNPTPWKVMASPIWNGIVSVNGKRVCNCRNIKDAELIVKAVNEHFH